MPQKPASNHVKLREEAKARYRDRKNIEAKWLDQYGNVSRENDYQRNRSCLTEVFNMLDVVMENCIDDFRKTHVLLSAEQLGPHTFQFTYEGEAGREISFRSPSAFAARATALRAIGYTISNDLFFDTRFLRNETTHGNQTVVLQHMQLSYDDTIKAMLSVADTLIELGMLDASLRKPPFEKLRVREGDTLSGGAYTIGPLIGEGGMSRVYRATQKRVGREIAVKELKPDTYSDDLIRHECEILLRLHHEQIPQIHDVFFENSTWYIVMSYVDGVTLDHFVEDSIHGKAPVPAQEQDAPAGLELNEQTRFSICRTLLEILGYLHSPEVGIVFADLAPDNIIIDSAYTPHLIDFGISGKLETRQALPAATRGYSAPEVFAGGILDQRADIYSFGYILRFLFTGLSPLEETETPTDELVQDKHIAEVINRCTAKNPEERYADIGELTVALFPESSASGASRGKRRALIAALAAAAVCAAGIGAWQYSVRLRESAEVTAPADTAADIPSFAESGLTDHVMEWNDAALEQGIRDTIGIPEGDILLSDVWDMKQLSLENAGISDISALTEFTNLEYLNLSGNNLENADALTSLTKLRELKLNDNQLSDLSFLENMNALATLNLDHNSVSDLKPLAQLTALSVLRLQRNTVEDISSLTEIPALQSLYLGENTLAPGSLSTIAGMTGLSVLDLSFCGLQGVSPLSGMAEQADLTELYLAGNNISDILPLKEFDSLTTLDLQNNPLGEDPSALSCLSGLTELTSLDLMNTGISDLAPLAGLTKLTTIDLGKNKITELSALHELTALQYLDVSSNQIASLEPLASLTDLGYLSAADNNLSGDISALEQLTSLTYLDLRKNKIRDISALANMTGLRELHLDENEISDYSALDGLHITEVTR